MREASDTFVMRVPPCHERPRVILGKPLQAKKKNVRDQMCALLTLKEIKPHTLMIILSYLFS